MHCLLDMENDVVDTTRQSQDLINAAGIDFRMLRLNRIIQNLRPGLRDTIIAVYGGRAVKGTQRAADSLRINRSSLQRRLFEADRLIAEALDELEERTKTC